MLGLIRRFSSLRPFSSLAPGSIQLTDNYNGQLEQVVTKETYREPRQIWVENFNTVETRNIKLKELHPDVFAAQPRIDIIHQNIQWQRHYRFVSFANAKNKFEVRGGGRKPWPQKGLGRARHGSIRSPLFRGGGVSHGPRSPKPHFYMLPFYTRVLGLTSAVSVKLAQDDLHLVDNLEIPTDDPKYLQDLVDTRLWGPSVLIVDDTDFFPYNITSATEVIKNIVLMPLFGLNVYSMLKYHTLVFTNSAADKFQERILYNLNRSDGVNAVKKFKLDQQ